VLVLTESKVSSENRTVLGATQYSLLFIYTMSESAKPSNVEPIDAAKY